MGCRQDRQDSLPPRLGRRGGSSMGHDFLCSREHGAISGQSWASSEQSLKQGLKGGRWMAHTLLFLL